MADGLQVGLAEAFMKQLKVSVPELMFVAATRGALGAGIGLLLAERLGKRRRRALGWTLAAIGALSTIPAAAAIRRRTKEPEPIAPHETAPPVHSALPLSR